jgi:pimeloyl-ACP methyl ester carboxylesterase
LNPTATPIALLCLVGCTSVPEAPALPAERRVPSADGLSIAYEQAGSGDPALLFVHGWCCDRAFWRAQLQVLGGERRVAALDLGGHGASGATRQRWTLQALAADVVAVARDLECDQLVLVGHSMGAPVALLAAAELAPRVRGVIAVESLHDVEFEYPPGFLAQVARSFGTDFPGSMRASLRSTLGADAPEALLEWVHERALRTDRSAALGLLGSLETFDLPAALAAARVPVRCINALPAGGRGLATDSAKGRAHADFDARLLSGVGHFPMLEDPRAFDEVLRQVVAELCAP